LRWGKIWIPAFAGMTSTVTLSVGSQPLSVMRNPLPGPPLSKCNETTLRLHPRQRLERNALRRRHFGSRQAHLGAQERPGAGFHEQVPCTRPGVVRGAPIHGIGNPAREGDQGMEACVEDRTDRNGEPEVARPLPRPARMKNWIPAFAGMTTREQSR